MAASFDIFLSHNSADITPVAEIGQKLKGAGLKPWLDTWELIAGTRWQGLLTDGLRACSTCGAFIGPDVFDGSAGEEVGIASANPFFENGAVRPVVLKVTRVPREIKAADPRYVDLTDTLDCNTDAWQGGNSGTKNPSSYA